MIRLEQIQLLEKKIEKAVEFINFLKQENQTLKSRIQKSQVRMNELESLLEQFKGEQNKIEAGIINALNKLDQLEDEISENQQDPEQQSHPDLSSETQRDLNSKSSLKQEPVSQGSSAFVAEEADNPPEKNDSREDDDSGDKEIELDIF